MSGRVIAREMARLAYPPGRLEEAAEIASLYADIMAAKIATMPDQVTLGDKRVLNRFDAKEGRIRADYRCIDGMVVFVSFDPMPPDGELLLHLSISYRVRDPRWNELKLVRQAFFPAEVDVIQVLPRAGEYVNVHQHTFHLYQAPELWRGGWNV